MELSRTRKSTRWLLQRLGSTIFLLTLLFPLSMRFYKCMHVMQTYASYFRSLIFMCCFCLLNIRHTVPGIQGQLYPVPCPMHPHQCTAYQQRVNPWSSGTVTTMPDWRGKKIVKQRCHTVIQFRNIYSQKCTSTGLAPKFEI